MKSLEALLREKKVLVCVGTGGVGKTTLSAALGVRAAQLGLQVVVLTIDPAKRLASTLGLQEGLSSSDLVKVPGQNFKGTLYAAVLDSKKVFDEFVRTTAPSGVEAERLLNNVLYRQLSTKLSGSQEFTALEKLYSLVRSNSYDLVIVDTPPAQHAIDFLSAPVRLHQIFDEGVIRWFAKPPSKRRNLFSLVSHVTSTVFTTLERLTGSQFIEELSNFFTSIAHWQKVLQEHTLAVRKMLTAEECAFCLITGFDEAKIQEAISLRQALDQGGYRLAMIIINRAFPQWMPEMSAHVPTKDLASHYAPLAKFYGELKQFYSLREKSYEKIGENLREIKMKRIPDLDQEVYSLEALIKLARLLEDEKTL